MKTKIESERNASARLSAELGMDISRASVRRLREKGIDTTDTLAVDHALKMQTKKPRKSGSVVGEKPNQSAGPSPTAPLSSAELDLTLAGLERDLLEAADYETGRSIRIKISGYRELVRIQKDRGQLIDRDQVEAEGYEAGLLFRHSAARFGSELLPMITGLGYDEAFEKVQNWIHQLLTDLHELTSQHLVTILQEMGATDAAARRTIHKFHNPHSHENA